MPFNAKHLDALPPEVQKVVKTLVEESIMFETKASLVPNTRMGSRYKVSGDVLREIARDLYTFPEDAAQIQTGLRNALVSLKSLRVSDPLHQDLFAGQVVGVENALAAIEKGVEDLVLSRRMWTKKVGIS